MPLISHFYCEKGEKGAKFSERTSRIGKKLLELFHLFPKSTKYMKNNSFNPKMLNIKKKIFLHGFF
jgi:hypothetical protein